MNQYQITPGRRVTFETIRRGVSAAPRLGTRGLTASNPKAPGRQRLSSQEASGHQLRTDATSQIHPMKTEEFTGKAAYSIPSYWAPGGEGSAIDGATTTLIARRELVADRDRLGITLVPLLPRSG